MELNNLNTITTSTQYYIDLLEKTNQQLSLWSNPYGILVMVLTFLVAFLTIVAAYVIYRQGQEHKKYYRNAVDEYKNTLTEKLQEISNEAEKKSEEVVKKLKVEEVRLKKIKKPTRKQANKIESLENRIIELESGKAILGSRASLSSGATLSSLLDSSVYISDPFTSLGGQIGKTKGILGINNDPSLGVLGMSSNPLLELCTCGNVLSGAVKYCSNCGKKTD